MIVSHKRKFIFFRTRKTAGASTEAALAKYCGKNDIITKDKPVNERKRGNVSRNFIFNGEKLDAHERAKSIRNKFPKEFKNYYKFCIERNPWDKVISAYYWYIKRNPNPISLKKFISSNVVLRFEDFDIYSIDGKIITDFVCRYENLNEDLKIVCKNLSIPFLKLPRFNSKYRRDRRNYKDVLDSESSSRIENIFERQIEVFDYKF